MDAHVGVSIGPLNKTASTQWVWTLVWSIICVDAQMVKKIVPLSVHLLAPLKIALENASGATSFRV